MREDDPLPRFYRVRLSDREAWFGAMVAALFNALGMLVELAIIRKTPGSPQKPAAISAFLALMLMVALFLGRKAPSAKWAYVAYSLTTVSVVTALLSTNLHFALLEGDWVPFQESKLGSLAAAVVAPGFWVGLVSILGYCLSATIQVQFFFPPELKTQTATIEPWPTLAFGLAGVLAIVYRFRRIQVEQELARVQAQNAAIRRLARVVLDIRDRMNTPLQVIELAADLLRSSSRPPAAMLRHIDRAVSCLRQINTVLVRHEKQFEREARWR